MRKYLFAITLATFFGVLFGMLFLVECANAGSLQDRRRAVIAAKNAAPAGGTITYVGYPNTDGVPNSTPASFYQSLDISVTTQWTATENGTAKTINAYVSAYPAGVDYEGVTLWKDIGGTITLIATGTFTGSASTWTGHVTLVAEAGQSLNFTIGDVLYFGGCGSSNIAAYGFGRNDAGGDGMYYNSGPDYSSGPPATTTFTLSPGREMGFIFGYE